MKPNASVPTDKELQDLWNDMYWEPGRQATPMIYRYARSVLERWGNIPQTPNHQPVSDW